MLRKTIQTIFILLKVFSVVIVFAVSVNLKAETQTKKEEPPKKYSLNFEDELVEGGVQKPDLLFLLQRKNFNFRKLIRLRENFLPEMTETGELLRGSGSGN